MAKVQIDALDKKILTLLMSNARMPFLEVARECGISGAAIHQRVQKLEDAGVITGSSFKVDNKVLGFNTCAYVGVFLEKANKYNDVVSSLEEIQEVVECHYTTGNYAVFVKVVCENNQHLMQVLNHTLQEIPGIASTETFISLEQPIQRNITI